MRLIKTPWMKPKDSTIPPSPEPGKPLHDPPPRRNTSFKGDVLRLVSGTGLAQLITILAAPILTRLYAPEAFGVAALFASITGILGVLACMRYELSIVLPDNDREAANLFGVSLCFSVLIALLTVPIVGYGGPLVSQWIGMPELAPYLWLVPITVLIQGVFSGLNYWNTRTKHFTRLSIARVTSAVASTSATLGAGFAGHATGGAMIAASVGGQIVATTVLGGQIWRDNGRFLVQSITWREMWSGVKKYKKFPIISSWSALMNTASAQMPTLLLSIFFSPVIVGFYALGHRLLSLPMNLLGSAIGQVFFQRASAAKSDGSIHRIVLATFERLLLIAAFPFLLLMAAGPELFSFIFGSKWVMAGVFVQILAPWLFINFLYSPISTFFDVYRIQEVELYMNIALITTRFASLVIGGMMEEVILALILFSISGTLIYLGFFIYLVLKSGGNARTLWSTLTLRLLTGVLFVVPTLVCKWIFDVDIVMILAMSALSACGYYAFTIARDRQLRAIILIYFSIKRVI